MLFAPSISALFLVSWEQVHEPPPLRGHARPQLFRLPYYGDDLSKCNTEGPPILEAQRLGYVVSIQDFDTDDWKHGEPSIRPAGADAALHADR